MCNNGTVLHYTLDQTLFWQLLCLFQQAAFSSKIKFFPSTLANKMALDSLDSFLEVLL